MFENFVVFTEVVKLSSNTYHFLREVNYHDKLLRLICNRKTNFLEHSIDLVEEDVLLIEQNVDILDNEAFIIDLINKLFDYKGEYKSRLLQCVFVMTKNLDKDGDIINILIYTLSSSYLEDNRLDVIAHFANVGLIGRRTFKVMIETGQIEIVKSYLRNHVDYANITPALTESIKYNQKEIAKHLFEIWYKLNP